MYVFTDIKVKDYTTATTSNTTKFAKYFKYMLESGIYLAPSQYEAVFISTAHTEADIDNTIQASYEALKYLTSE